MIAGGIALLLHLLLVPALVWLFFLNEADHDEESRTRQAFELFTIPDDATAPQEDEEDPDLRRQHVALPAPEIEERPEDADYADQYDRTVEEETVAEDDPEPTETTSPSPEPERPAPRQRRAADRQQPAEAPSPQPEPVADDSDLPEDEAADEVARTDDADEM